MTRDAAAATRDRAPIPGYTVHFNHIRNVAEAARIVREAHAAGAGVLNVVPPARIWWRPVCVRMLDRIFQESERRGMRIVLTRLDACYPDGPNELFEEVLTQPGRLPDGKPTSEWFMATVAVPRYEEWLAEETRYYARRYGRRAALAGFAPGGFVEPFVSQRGSIAAFDTENDRYEIAQYTPEMKAWWARWLRRRYRSPAAADRDYGAAFGSWAEFPLPGGEDDSAYRHSRRAYFDFVRCIGDWWVGQYRRLHALWHAHSRAPLIWQFNGFEAEKLEKGWPAFAALDVPAWLRAADAVGLSLYTYPGYPEAGHPAICATVRLVASAVEAGKQLYVLEGGTESPAISYDPYQLAFITRVALPLRPRTQIYEYFKYQPREEPLASGIMLAHDFRVQEPAYTRIRAAYAAADRLAAASETPWLYWLQLPAVAREDADNAAFTRLAYEAAGWLPLRVLDGSQVASIPRGAWVLLPPDRRRLAGAAFYRRLAALAAARGWRVIRDQRLRFPTPNPQRPTTNAQDPRPKTQDPRPNTQHPTPFTLDLCRLARMETLEEGTDALFAALRRWRDQVREVPPPGIVPRRGLAAVPLRGGVEVFVEDAAPVSLDLRTLRRGSWFSFRLYDGDGSPRPVCLLLRAGARLTLQVDGRPAPLTAAGGGAARQFQAMAGRSYRIRCQ